MLLMIRSTMFVRDFANGLFAWRPPVCGRTIGEMLMYRSRPLSWIVTSATSHRSNSLSWYDGRFFATRFFGFSGGGASPSGGIGTLGGGGTPSAGRTSSGGGGGI